MPLTIRAIFRGPHNYAHNDRVHVDVDDECMICKEPYSKTSDTKGCRAIRLAECGHIVGFECFRTWIQRLPDTCPYWNHHLSPWAKPTFSIGNCVEYSLETICSTAWFASMEDSIGDTTLEHPEVPLMLGHIQYCDALQALHEYRLDLGHAGRILAVYGIDALSLAGVLCGVVYVVIVALYGSFCLLRALCWVSWAAKGNESVLGSLGSMAMTLGKLALWIVAFGIAHTLLFLAVVVGVLGLGWWRSGSRRKRS